MSSNPPSAEYSEILWRQYAQHIDLYKFYISTVIKINLFYYAVTGAILSYFFGSENNGWVQYSLLLPIVFSIGFCILLVYGAVKVPAVRGDVMDICGRLDLKVMPEVNVLVVFLWVSAVMLAVVGVAVSILFIAQPGGGSVSANPALAGVDRHWFSIGGLVLDLAGAVFLAIGYFVSKSEAIELGVSRVCSDDPEENLKLPAVKERLGQSRKALAGVIMLALGFLLQIIGNWPV